jgi:hypothetical protein
VDCTVALAGHNVHALFGIELLLPNAETMLANGLATSGFESKPIPQDVFLCR